MRLQAPPAGCMKEWFTAAELAALRLPLMPEAPSAMIRLAKRQEWNRPDRECTAETPLGVWRKREGRGGGIEYHYSLLPSAVQARLLVEGKAGPEIPEAAPETERRKAKASTAAAETWEWFDRQPDKVKEKARIRLATLDAVQAMVLGGVAKDVAVALVAAQRKLATSSLWNWFGRVQGQDRKDWLPFLADRYVGRTVTVEIPEEAWEAFKDFYLRPERPTLTRCYRDVEQLGAAKGWALPSEKTFARKIEREIAPAVITLCRHGVDALKRMYPAQQRDRSVFHALEAINGDGHKWDVFVRWPDGEILRPMMVAWQDLYSGKILGWRVAKSENRESLRLSLGDVVEVFGIPDLLYIDNTRAFANKWLTGGAQHRFRWKLRDEDPIGICEQLGIDVRFVLPYSGQSKPVERAFRDLAHDAAKAPEFAGAYVGNNPTAKPENYGSRAIPLDTFLQVVAREISSWNARAGRRSAVAQGRSFDDLFDESYIRAAGQGLIRKATEEQKRLWLLAAEGVTAGTEDGALKLLGNRFWSEFLHFHRGEKLITRFDPQNLLAGLHVYALDGRHLGFAEVIEAAGFNDVNAAREHARQRTHFIRATKAAAKAERKMDAIERAGTLPEIEPAAPPEAKVVRGTFRAGKFAAKAHREPTAEEMAAIRRLEAEMAEDASPKVVTLQSQTIGQRLARVLDIERRIAAGEAVSEEDRAYAARQARLPDIRNRRDLYEEFGEMALQA